MNKEISNTDDLIDSRDVIDRINELKEQLEDHDSYSEFDHDEIAEELKTLVELAEQGEGSADWSYGETLINDDYFETYARDLAEDLGYMSGSIDANAWPYNCIDWEQAARDLQHDYMSLDFNGATYWIRA